MQKYLINKKFLIFGFWSLVFGFFMVGCAWIAKDISQPSLILLYKKPDTSLDASFGASLSSAGDVNADGKGDFLVGAPRADPEGRENAGSVYLYSGSDGTLLGQLDGSERSGTFGSAIAPVGDINNDGKGDFVIGASWTNTGQGSVYMYSGANLSSALYKKEVGAAETQIRFGATLTAGGDLNGDGKNDFMVGATMWNEEKGAVYVYSGVDGTSLWPTIEGGAKGDHFGSAIASSGDVNGDGKADFLVGAPAADPEGKTDAGSTYVYSGSNGQLLRQINGSVEGDYFGSAVVLTDVNNDSKSDFIIAAPNADAEGKIDVGQVYVYSGADGALLYQKNGTSAGDHFGTSLASLGDINGDNKSDVIVGAPGTKSGKGSIYLFSGADGSLLYQKDSTVSESFGSVVASGGDVNGDGKNDFLVGASGAVYIYSLP